MISLVSRLSAARGQGRLHQLLAALRMAAAAILHQELDQCPCSIKVGAVEDGAALAFRPDKSGPMQDRKMAGERACRHIEIACKIAGGDRLRREPDQLPKNLETSVLRQRPECGERLFRFHISRIIEQYAGVNSEFVNIV